MLMLPMLNVRDIMTRNSYFNLQTFAFVSGVPSLPSPDDCYIAKY